VHQNAGLDYSKSKFASDVISFSICCSVLKTFRIRIKDIHIHSTRETILAIDHSKFSDLRIASQE